MIKKSLEILGVEVMLYKGDIYLFVKYIFGGRSLFQLKHSQERSDITSR